MCIICKASFAKKKEKKTEKHDLLGNFFLYLGLFGFKIIKKCDQILLGCDGIFDFLSNEDCSQLISQLKTQQMQQLESVMNHINADLVTILQQSSLKSPNNLSQFYIDCIKLIIIFDDSIFQ